MPATGLRTNRLTAIDVFRGFVMFLMAAELMKLAHVARQFPDSSFWQIVGRHTSHVAWTGCSLHDLIQPGFSFLVGVALPFSIASRLAKGQNPGRLWLHALWRSVLLVLLGVFLRSIGSPMTHWTFTDTLSQIGLGYPFLFLLGLAGTGTRWAALAVVLIGYWMAFVLFPQPPADFNYTAANVAADWPHHFEGFTAHWNINSNAAWAFDMWFLNLFPRDVAFTGSRGGYVTLSFIPTLGTMILGLIAGAWLKLAADGSSPSPNPSGVNAGHKEQNTPAMAATLRLTYAGFICLALGWALHTTGLCPVVKRIWTPAWTLFSGGWCFLILAGFYFVTEVQGWRRWAFPLIVIGMNSIAMYVLVHTVTDFLRGTLHTHLGRDVFKVLGDSFVPVLEGGAVLLILWLILFWMHRRRLYLRI